MEPLRSILAQAGQTTVPLTFADGSRLLLLPAGGRVLGLYAPGAEENFLWTNPALAPADSAKAYFARDGWPNPGGDRTWLAPEIEFFIGDLARVPETYRVPPALDPGAWWVREDQQTANLMQEAELPLLRSGGAVRVRIGKSFAPAPNPLLETDLAELPLDYAGYTQRTTLECLSATGNAHQAGIGLWNLLQLPQPGKMLIPTAFPVQPQVVFGNVAPADLAAAPGQLCWTMTGAGGDAKIALKAGPLTGRVGHLSRAANLPFWHLVIRQFQVHPAGEYVDALWTDPAARGYAFQACCVGSGKERFNELEYHVPAVRATAGQNQCVDESQVWAFCGITRSVEEIARLLLGVEIDLRR